MEITDALIKRVAKAAYEEAVRSLAYSPEGALAWDADEEIRQRWQRAIRAGLAVLPEAE